MVISENNNSKPNVLVVDDVVINLEILAEIVKSNGYIARTVTSVAQAQEAIKELLPQHILLDISHRAAILLHAVHDIFDVHGIQFPKLRFYDSCRLIITGYADLLPLGADRIQHKIPNSVYQFPVIWVVLIEKRYPQLLMEIFPKCISLIHILILIRIFYRVIHTPAG